MGESLDKKISGLSLVEDDEPFVLPDLPEFCSIVRNKLSLIGRLLNPFHQKMSDVILEMPRKWQLYERVQGVALTRDKFQFIFKYEQDLAAILARGVHTYNQWPMVTERWVPKPPEDYLQFLEIWVQIRNIPVNYRTGPSIAAMGEFVGPVVEVVFDPDKPQTNSYERAKVRFNVANPLKLAKKVKFPGGEIANILFDYERIQLRCTICQRVTHFKDQCPFAKSKAVEIASKMKSGSSSNESNVELIIKEKDPLFGVVKEAQVGINPLTGRPKIVPEVLADLRLYLEVANGPEKLARKERVKKTLLELESDPMGQKTMLRLEPPTIITPMLDKGKGRVFDFSRQEDISSQRQEKRGGRAVLEAVNLGQAMSISPMEEETRSVGTLAPGFFVDDAYSGGSTGFRIGFCETSSSGTKPRKARIRRRPGTYRRKPRAELTVEEKIAQEKGKGCVENAGDKRKIKEDVETSTYSRRSKKPMVVPKEGLPKC